MGKETFNHFKEIIDVTLREGRQFHSANFTIDQQIWIVEQLNKIGIGMVEVSNPVSPETFTELQQLTNISNRPSFLAHVRNRVGDIQAAIDSGVEGVNILCISDKERLRGMGITHEEHMAILQQSILTAQKAGLEIRVGSEHYFNANSEDKELAHQAFRLADNLGVARISIPDTLGIAMGRKVAEEVAFIKSLLKADIEVHFHNDLMQANANAITAVENGASYVDTTILGIGERTGITSLSPFLIALYKIDPDLVGRYHLEYLTETDQIVAEMIGKEIPFNMITSLNGLTHKSGVHINGVIRHGPGLYEAVPPKLIGNDRRLVIETAISGRTSQEQLDDFYNRYGTK